MSNIRPLTEREKLEYLVEFLKEQKRYYELELEKANNELALLHSKKFKLEKRNNN